MATIGRRPARAPLSSSDIPDGVVHDVDLHSTLDLGNKTVTLGSPTVTGTITTTNHGTSAQWNTAYGWGDHSAAGYQAASSALTTATTFSGDVSGTYNSIVVADNSHNHEWANITNLPDPVITLAGDVSGSATMTNLGSATITVTVADDSHTHDTRYYTETEIDNYFSGSSAITGYNKTNWDTAYGWGDHASVGYLTGNQTITLTGDVSGSGTTSIAVTIADDSHNHVISNVDGLQTALDAKQDASTALTTSNYTSTLNAVYANRTGDTFTGNVLFSDSGTTKRGVRGIVGTNDYWFFGGGATASNAGYVEIAAGDDGSTSGSYEPIYVRQYLGDPLTGTVQRTLTLLDNNGDTDIPNDLSIGGDIAAVTRILFGTAHQKDKIKLIPTGNEWIGTSGATLELSGDSINLNAGQGTGTPNLKMGGTTIIDSGRSFFASGTGSSTAPALSITSSSSIAFIHASNAFAPNMTTGQTHGHFFGKAASLKNAGGIGYYWSSSGSNDNFVSIGHWGADHLLRVHGDGTVNINSGRLDMGGTTVIDTSRNLTNITSLSVGGSQSGSANSIFGNTQYALTVQNSSRNDNQDYYDTLFIRNTNYSSSGVSGQKAQIGFATVDAEGDHHRAQIIAKRDTAGGTAGGQLELVTRSGGTLATALTLRHDKSAEFAGNIKIGSSTVINSVAQLKSPVTGNRNQGNILLGDSSASGTSKWATVAGTHYNQTTGSGNGSANAGVMIIGSHSTSTANEVYIGGGPYELNPATKIVFSTHNATTHNLGGSIKATIDSGGNFNLTTGAYQVNGTTVIDSARNLTNVGSIASTSYISVRTGLRMDRAYADSAIWFTGSVDANHCLWNDYYGGPTTKGGAGSGFDGIKWNTYRGLHVRGGLGGAYNLIVAENSSGSSNDHYVRLYQANAERFRTTSAGISVTGAVQIAGTTVIDSARNLTNMGTGEFSGKVNFQGDAAIEGGGGYGIFKGYTGNNNHMVVSRGIVSGSTSSPTITGGHNLTLVEYCNTTDTTGFYFKTSDTGTYYEIARITRAGITSIGNVTAYSDIRIKEEIQEITGAIDKVKAIRGVTFKRKDDDRDRRHAGVIAQEVEAVLPEVITDNEDGMKSVAYGNMVGLLIEAMKEQQTQIEALQAKIEELENGNH